MTEFREPRQQRVIGTGAFGCVIWPALLFYNSERVSKYNSEYAVTKIARDAHEEFDIAMEILRRTTPRVGIFPVDNLVCGIKYADVKPFYEQAGRKCRKQLGELFFTHGDRIQAEASLRPRYDVPQRPRFINGGQDPLNGGQLLCAIQYQKYDQDLHAFYESPNDQNKYQRLRRFRRQLEAKQDILHNARVVHLDIKLPNLCEFNNEAYFADWGKARFLDSELHVSNVIREITYPAIKEYYGKLMPNATFRKENNVDITFKQELESYYTSIHEQLTKFSNEKATQKEKDSVWAPLYATIIDLDRLLLIAALMQIRITLPP